MEKNITQKTLDNILKDFPELKHQQDDVAINNGTSNEYLFKKTKEIHFAPLQGYTDAIYRNAHNKIIGGTDTYYTPFLRIEKGEVRKKELTDLAKNLVAKDKLIIQLLPSEEEEIHKFIEATYNYGYTNYDLNFGCPFPPITNKGKGSGILNNLAKVSTVLNAISHYPDLKFSVKMRLGNEQNNEIFELIPLLNSATLSHITIHPRIGKQQYKGNVDIETFNKICRLIEQPIIYNGDIKNREDVEILLDYFPNLKGVMIGRGLLSRPTLAMEIKENIILNEREYKAKIKELHKELFTHYSQLMQGESQILNKMQTFWEYVGCEFNKRLHKAITKCSKLDNYNTYVNEILS